MAKRNAEEGTNLKLFHAFCTAVARAFRLRPDLNNIISGRHYWRRKAVSLSFVTKRAFKDGAEEALMFLNVTPDMRLDDISKAILGDVSKIRGDYVNDLGDMMNTFAKMPRFLLKIIFGWARLMEYFGIIPESLKKGDPNYSTALLSNLGSIGAGAPYHHLSNYGTCSWMITIGTVHKEKKIMPDGTEQERDMLPVAFTVDERIADGFYLNKSLRITRYLLEHPEHLNETVDTPVPVEL